MSNANLHIWNASAVQKFQIQTKKSLKSNSFLVFLSSTVVSKRLNREFEDKVTIIFTEWRKIAQKIVCFWNPKVFEKIENFTTTWMSIALGWYTKNSKKNHDLWTTYSTSMSQNSQNNWYILVWSTDTPKKRGGGKIRFPLDNFTLLLLNSRFSALISSSTDPRISTS